METEETTSDQLGRSTALRLQQLKGQLFEVALVAATLVGILAVLALFVQISSDAFQPETASPAWFLVYLGTLVGPTAAFTLYARRRPAVRETNAKAFAAVFGGLLLALVTYAVVDSLSPYDVFTYAFFASLPPALVLAYDRTTEDRTYTGPAIPASIIVGVAVAALLYDFVRGPIGVAAEWILYFGLVTVPAALLVWTLTASRRGRRSGALAGGIVAAGGLAVAVASIVTGANASLLVVLYSAFIVPTGYVLWRSVRTDPEGRVGVAGPFVLLGGTLLGAAVVDQFGIRSPDSFLTPNLLLQSWDGLTASNAGVYPQIVGSIIIVGFMAVLAFPVGIGAAIYLEEYAPDTGLRGRLATILEVNISNLAGVPSVVYGLLGLALFRRTLGFGTGIVVTASGTLGLLILPIVIVSTQEALRSVPDDLRQGSYGMGASRWQTLREVVLPEAIPGTLTGTILALARAIGETAPLVIIAIATTTYSPPSGLFSSGTALPLQIFAASANAKPEFRHGVVPAAAVVLLILMLLMNATAIVIRNKYGREN
ncbi:phosphate ABC transporter permease PstA [Halorubrum tebenquichense]|uniref:Phosphate transport system permease protein PstA n=1 Tax=Halorubrum tebenquichense DSM 14210 TaxID=1227485 RepID=M0DCE2_9EURY|nr:phosphate ABC transporter permease PstA [Halorubrum tebenquichense]ELZ33125.1 phosphate ABC transporter permease [Halorubrum tebenquichense DSM 14210]